VDAAGDFSRDDGAISSVSCLPDRTSGHDESGIAPVRRLKTMSNLLNLSHSGEVAAKGASRTGDIVGVKELSGVCSDLIMPSDTQP